MFVCTTAGKLRQNIVDILEMNQGIAVLHDFKSKMAKNTKITMWIFVFSNPFPLRYLKNIPVFRRRCTHFFQMSTYVYFHIYERLRGRIWAAQAGKLRISEGGVERRKC